MAELTATLVVTFSNDAAFRALCEAVEIVSDLAEDQPWNAEMARVVELLRVAALGITVRP